MTVAEKGAESRSARPDLLAAEIRGRLGPSPEPPSSDWPLLSIIVLNRDGASLLRRLLAGLIESTDYPNFELILVDNGSADDSLDFIRRAEAPFPISIVANQHNESFSDGCNQGAELARGELLLFLNNDIEPFEPGWLRELVACLRNSNAGAVASTLVCLDEEHKASFRYGYGVQHRGLAFREEASMIHPALYGWEADPLDERLGEDAERGAVAAACVLLRRDAYRQVGGFSHGYVYGGEDIDLCLKLRADGLGVLCSGRSVAIHHPVSTRRTAPFEEEKARKLANRLLLWERWGPQLRREYELDLLAGGGIWVGADSTATRRKRAGEQPRSLAEIDALGFCFRAADPAAAAVDLDTLVEALRQRGRRCLALVGERAEDQLGLNYDVAVHVQSPFRYVRFPAQLNVLWAATGAAALAQSARERYDLVLATAEPPTRFAGRLIAEVDASSLEAGFRRRVNGRA
jgi:GT2 family glycosyltransferase